jgi:cytochrome b-561
MGSDEQSKLYEETTPLQRASAVVSIVSVIVGLILLVTWSNTQSKDSGLGGYNWDRLIFTYHPTFMYSALVLGSFSAIVSYRVLPFTKYVTKSIHGLLHTGAIVSIILGLSCVIMGNNDESKNDSNGFYANLFSLHSFIGLGAVIVYFLNYMFGLIHFVPSLEVIPGDLRKAYMPYHVFFGTFAVVASAMAVETGIMEAFVEVGCGYSVDSADINPAEHYHRLNYGCKLANGVGVLVYLALFTLLYAIYRFEKQDKSVDHRDPLLV